MVSIVLQTTPSEWFFNGWSNVLRVIAVGVPAYAALIVLLRVSGKRTLSKMNAFDLVVTVAFGSMLASLLLSPTTTLVQGVTGFAFLIVAQLVITWWSTRSPTFLRLVKAEPSLLYYQGRFVEAEMRRQRVTRVEVAAAAREQGYATLDDVAVAVLETDGSLSIIQSAPRADAEDFVRRLRARPMQREDADADA